MREQLREIPLDSLELENCLVKCLPPGGVCERGVKGRSRNADADASCQDARIIERCDRLAHPFAIHTDKMIEWNPDIFELDIDMRAVAQTKGGGVLPYIG